MVSYTREKLRYLLTIDFVRFCIVGGTGFTINLIVLAALHRLLDMPILLAQIIAAEIALFSNFMLHHHWTYKKNRTEKTLSMLIMQFHASSWPAILGSAVMVSVGVQLLHFNELLALIITAFTALSWNFIWSKYVIWRDVSAEKVPALLKQDRP